MAREFPTFNENDAPFDARPALLQSRRAFGTVPAPLTRYASSPLMLDTALSNLHAFEQSSLTELEREVVALTMGHANDCKLCVSMHLHRLDQLRTEPEMLRALRRPGPLPDARLEALRSFVLNALEKRGDVDAEVFATFRARGFEHRQALDVLLGVATYTLTTFANRLTETSEV